jgi:hypothetical protein
MSTSHERKERGNDPLAAMPLPANEASGRNGEVACTP